MGRRFFPRGPTSVLASYVLAPAEVVYDTDLQGIRIGNGVTPGGNLLPQTNVFLRSLTSTGDSSDRKSDIEAAAAAAGPTGAFILGVGNYQLSATPNFSTGAIVSFGGQYSGAGMSGIADGSISEGSSVWMGVPTAEPTLKCTFSAHMVGLPGGSHTTSFQKNATSCAVVIYDDSIFSFDGDGTLPAVTVSARDFVGSHAQVYIAGGLGITRARAFGANYQVIIGGAGQEGTGDGAAAGAELGIDNYGTDSPYLQSARSKVVLNLAVGGTRLVTAFSFCGLRNTPENGAGAYYGHAVDGAAVRQYGFTVLQNNDGVNPTNSLWGITPTGAEEFKAQATPPAPSAGRARIYFDGTDLKMVLPGGTVKTFQAV